jgi:diguanylate cyclase (GGDEF)-like protein
MSPRRHHPTLALGLTDEAPEAGGLEAASPGTDLLDVAIAVGSATSEQEILDRVMERVGELIPYDRATVALISDDRGWLEIHNLSLAPSFEDTGGEKGRRLPLDESTVLGWVALHQRPHLRRRRSDEPGRFASAQVGPPVPSHIVAPLVGRNSTLGVLTVGSYLEDAFDLDDVALFCRYARLVGLALSNMRIFERVQQLAMRDALTGLYNRRKFQTVLTEELRRCERYHGPLSLLLIDLDRFKSFNDRFGHPAGDELLRQTARILESSLRETDSVFRCGGEEFAAVLPATSAESAGLVAHKLLARLRADNRYQASAEETVAVTASLGIATAPADATDAEGLIAAADRALYHAKGTGRDTAVAFSTLPRTGRPAGGGDGFPALSQPAPCGGRSRRSRGRRAGRSGGRAPGAPGRPRLRSRPAPS